MVTVSGVVVQLLGWMLAIKMIFLLSFLLNPANSSSIWKTCEDVSDPVACFCHACDIFITVTDVIKSSKVFSYNFQSFLYKRQSTQVICQSSCRCKILCRTLHVWSFSPYTLLVGRESKPGVAA